MNNQLISQTKPLPKLLQQLDTNAVLAECGDVLGGLFHPAFKQVAFWNMNNVFAFNPETTGRATHG